MVKGWAPPPQGVEPAKEDHMQSASGLPGSRWNVARNAGAACLLAALLLLAPPPGAAGARPSLPQLQALEHELLTQKAELLAQTEDPNRVFVKAQNGGIVTFDRAAIKRVVQTIAFLAVEDDLAARVLPLLPASIRTVVEVAQGLGMWNETFIAERVLDEIDRRSDATRIEARRRVVDEYDPLIEAVRAAAAERDEDPAVTAGNPCDMIPGLWSWFVNGDVTFRAGGTLVQGPRTGRWTCAGTDVSIVWSHGFTDDLTISADGQEMSGRNQVGMGVAGQRIGDAN